jgi:hypothetical protein
MLLKKESLLRIRPKNYCSSLKLIALAVFIVFILTFSLSTIKALSAYGNTYQALTVIDVHSHPKAGDQWKVSFQTIGQADLRIIPADKATINDLRHVWLACDGKEKKPQILANAVIYYPGWKCDGTGQINNFVKTAGNHTLKFEFGKQIDYAYNTNWLSGWNYRKSHVINSASGTGTGYQVKIIVHYNSGTDTGGDVYLNSKSKTDFSDVRFTSSDGNTLLGYWLEQKTDSNNAIFWVKVNDDLSSSAATIYVYYGNASAANASNGANTFLFFDDFSGDLSKWTIDPANTDKVSISAGALRHDPDSTQSRNSYSDTRIITSSFQMTDGIIEYKVYLAGSSSSSPRIIHQLGWRVQSLNFENGYCWRLQNSAADGGPLKFASGSWSAFGSAYNAAAGNTWHTVKEVVAGSNYTGYVDGGSGYSGADSTKLTAGYLISHVHGVSLDSSSYVLVDDIRVRKYVATEPTHGSWGTEENTPIISISVSDGTVNYGTMPANTTKDTTSSGLNDTQTLTNNGNVLEDFTIEGQNTACPWILAASNGSDQYKHEFSTNSGGNWTATTTSYQSLASNIAASGTSNLDLRLTMPTSTNCYTQQSVNVSILATQH